MISHKIWFYISTASFDKTSVRLNLMRMLTLPYTSIEESWGEFWACSPIALTCGRWARCPTFSFQVWSRGTRQDCFVDDDHLSLTHHQLLNRGSHSSCRADLMQFQANSTQVNVEIWSLSSLDQVTELNVPDKMVRLPTRPAIVQVLYQGWCRQPENLSSLESPWRLWHDMSRTLWEGICSDDCRLRLDSMKTKQPVNIYTILSFIIAYHKKSKHMPILPLQKLIMARDTFLSCALINSLPLIIKSPTPLPASVSPDSCAFPQYPVAVIISTLMDFPASLHLSSKLQYSLP